MNNERDTEAILREVKVEFGSDEFKTRAARLETWEKIEAGMERQADRRRLVRRLVRATASVAAAAVAGIGVFLLFGTEPELVTVANRTGEPRPSSRQSKDSSQ